MSTLPEPGAETVILINREPVELYKILKFEGLASSGGEAKMLISAGNIQVNGAPETRKRRKMLAGDTIVFSGNVYVLKKA